MSKLLYEPHMQRITIRFPSYLLANFDRVCQWRGVNRSALLRRAVTSFMREYTSPVEPWDLPPPLPEPLNGARAHRTINTSVTLSPDFVRKIEAAARMHDITRNRLLSLAAEAAVRRDPMILQAAASRREPLPDAPKEEPWTRPEPEFYARWPS